MGLLGACSNTLNIVDCFTTNESLSSTDVNLAYVHVFSIECLYPPGIWLVHDFEACILAPQQSIDVTFSFYPRQPIKYKDAVTFEINGLSRQSVEFTGQGTELQVLSYLDVLCVGCVGRVYCVQ